MASIRAPDSVYANLVFLALALLRQEGIGGGPQVEIPEALLERLELTREDANKVIHKILDARDALKTLVSNYQHD